MKIDYREMKNDRVSGLKAKVTCKSGSKKTVLTYAGKYGQGYDGCGTHTHSGWFSALKSCFFES